MASVSLILRHQRSHKEPPSRSLSQPGGDVESVFSFRSEFYFHTRHYNKYGLDEYLPANKNQSGATCHRPSAGGFIDDRPAIPTFVDAEWDENVPPPVSQGSDPILFDGRNTPSAAYAAFSPAFRLDDIAALYVGGQFWDGGEMSLAGQAAGPFHHPVEMAMHGKKAVVQAVKTADCQALFTAAYATEEGDFDLCAVDASTNQGALEGYAPPAKAIGEFEKTQLFNTFNSKYDHFLAGHQVPDLGSGGVLSDPNQHGKFKVRTLRNIEITAPYGHNGVLQTLEQIVHFSHTRDVLPICTDNLDPGFGVSCWPAPEAPATMNVAELGNLRLTTEQERHAGNARNPSFNLLLFSRCAARK